MLRSSLLPLLLALGLAAVACQGEVIVIVDGTTAGTGASSGVGGAPTVTVATTTATTTATTATTSVTTVSTTTTTVTSVTSTSSGGPDCFTAPDCFECLCTENPVGCDGYFQGVVDDIYCGMSCGTSCVDFCDDPNNQFPDFPCDDCVNGNGLSQDDIDAFLDGCLASPECGQFLTDLQNCPF